MPVGEIHAVLATPDLAVRNALIATHLRRLEAELSRTQDAVASLRDILEHPAKDRRIERRRIEQAPAAVIRETMRAKDALSWFLGAMTELSATVEAQKLARSGVRRTGGIFANSLFSQGRGEAIVFVPCKGTVRPTARVFGGLIPGAEGRGPRPRRFVFERRHDLRGAGHLRGPACATFARPDSRVLPLWSSRHRRRDGMAYRDWLAYLPHRLSLIIADSP